MVDNSARIIKAGEAMKENVHEDEIADLDMYFAELLYARAYANLCACQCVRPSGDG